RISAPIVDAAKSNFLIFPYVPSDGGLVNRALRLRALDRSCMVWFVCGRIGFFMPIAVAPSKMLFSKTLWRRGWVSNPRYGYPYNGFRDRSVLDRNRGQVFSVFALPCYYRIIVSRRFLSCKSRRLRVPATN